MTPEAPLRVASSSTVDERGGNPYPWALAEALRRQGVEVRGFDLQSVTSWRPDVVLVHWPEGGLRHPGVRAAAAELLRTLCKLGVARARRIPVVWIAHNLDAHDRLHPRLEPVFWRLFLPLVSGVISLSDEGRRLGRERFPAIAGRPWAVIPHGDYRDWYDAASDKLTARRHTGLDETPFLMGFVGRIYRYKGVDDLVRAFRECSASNLRLLIAGEPESSDLRDELTRLTGDDQRIELHLRSVPDADLAQFVSAVDLVVLPYRRILNSGAALLALSFSRPVLAPRLGALPDLQADVGDGWVRLYDGALQPAALEAAVAWASTRTGSPDLASRSWESIGRRTKQFFLDVCAKGESAS